MNKDGDIKIDNEKKQTLVFNNGEWLPVITGPAIEYYTVYHIHGRALSGFEIIELVEEAIEAREARDE